MVWKRVVPAGALILVVLLVTLQVTGVPAHQQQPDPDACHTTTGVVRIPTGTKSATGFLFTPSAHQTYLYEVPVIYPGGPFTLSKVGGSSVTVLGHTFPDFDVRIELANGQSQSSTASGDDVGTIHPTAVTIYVYMPYGPDPLLIGDNNAAGSAFTFVQCSN